jgi:hypothetical protein
MVCSLILSMTGPALTAYTIRGQTILLVAKGIFNGMFCMRRQAFVKPIRILHTASV